MRIGLKYLNDFRYSCEIQMNMLVINILQSINSWGLGVGGGGGGGRDQNLVYLQKVLFCVNVF